MPSRGRRRRARRRPAPACRTSARSPRRRRPRSRSAIRCAGSIRWRAPRGCTTRRAPRQLLHQQADAAGVVEVDVGRDDEVDRVGVEPGGGERGEQARHRVVGAGVDEGGAAALDDQVGGVEAAAGESRCRRRGCRASSDSTKSGARRAARSRDRSRGAMCVRARSRGADSRERGRERGQRPTVQNLRRADADAAGDEIDEAMIEAALRLIAALSLRRGGGARTLMRHDAPAACRSARRSPTRASRLGAGDEYPLPGRRHAARVPAAAVRPTCSTSTPAATSVDVAARC